MPLSAQRRPRPRKQPDVPQKSDVDELEETVTPNRKRRRMNNDHGTVLPNAEAAVGNRASDSASRKRNRSSDIKVFEDESFNEEDTDNVIRNLKEAKYSVAARMDYANEVHEANNPGGKQAYAKIAGNGWTFYVDELEVRIGRPPDERQPDDLTGGISREATSDKSLVHIDLGPSKLVSRQHADIRYNDHSAGWYIAVNGRNGVRLDGENLGRNETGSLHSGCVIEIAGTQMMFVTPNEVPAIHPSISAQTKALHDNEDDEDEMDLMGPPTLPHRTPTRRGASSQGGGQQRLSSSHGQSPSNTKSADRGGQDQLASSTGFAPYDRSAEAAGPSSQLRSGASPSFSRGLMLETADDIDYAVDSARDLKPPHSYAQLIGMAILSTAEEKLTLARIYEWIKERYAFYRFSSGGWQNSIRHNLSLNKSFEKVARRTDEPGKGMKWQIVPAQRDDFIRKGLNHARRPPGRGSSAPNSPSKELASGEMARSSDQRSQQQYSESVADDKRTSYSFNVKTSPGSTPPIPRHSQNKNDHTPDHGGNPLVRDYTEVSSPVKGLGMGMSPFRYGTRWDGLTEAAAAGSPGGPRISLGSEPNDHLVTPLFTRQAPKLAPPSTSRLPSQFMPLSSPAPFWKYADYGSTPAQPPGVAFGTSPMKNARILASGHKHEMTTAPPDDETAVDAKVGGIRSSSPPIPEGALGQESPTHGMGQRSANDAKGVMQPLMAMDAGRAAPASLMPALGGLRTRATMPTPALQTDVDEDEDDDEGGMIDLARGFQPIGSFHRHMSTGLVGRD